MKKLEFTSHWWLPDNPQKKLCGNLVYIPNEGSTLTLIGSFRDNENYVSNIINRDFKQNEIILGLDEEENEITLFGCTEKPQGIRMNNGRMIIRQHFSIDYIFNGHHFKKVEDIKFNKISVNYSYLEEWINKPLSPMLLTNKEDKEDYKFYLNLKKSESITIFENDEYKIFTDFVFVHPLFSLRKFVVKQKAFLSFKYLKEEKPWNELYDIINLMQDFLTVATMQSVYPLHIQGITESCKTNQVAIDIIICNSKIPTSFENIHSYNMLFSLDDINDKINIILPTWFANSSQSKLIYSNYFAMVYDNSRRLNDHFLNIIIALESYHRKNFDNCGMDPEEYNKRVQTILESIPEELFDWVEYKFKYNEPNLRKRLGELIKDYYPFFGGKKIANKFLDQAVFIRNKGLIHKNEEKSIEVKKLAYIMELLKIIFEICLLRDMGFNVPEITELIEKKKEQMNLVFEYMGMN